MKDYQASLEKLGEDTAEAARDSAKREMFDRLHQNFMRLAVEKAMKSKT
jgi:hypothetical protein